MYKLVYTKEFLEELSQIESYIAQDDISNALLTVQSILSSVILLKTFPWAWKEYSFGLRIFVEKNYKYRIIDKIEKENVYLTWVSKFKNI